MNTRRFSTSISGSRASLVRLTIIGATIMGSLLLAFAVLGCGDSSSGGSGSQAQTSAPTQAGSTGSGEITDLSGMIRDFDSNASQINQDKGKSVNLTGKLAGFGGYPPSASVATQSVMTLTPTGAPGTAVDCIAENTTMHALPQPGWTVTISGTIDSFQAQGSADKVQPQGKRIIVQPCTLNSAAPS